ncbi:purine permease 10 [Hibiscus trionum]|uniref:Probable purine permease n=1 Tax=Hibiscus trionum TaxID=183268 RepID=A0A9W7H9D2_HIBTR|nr:purine permease 10 [Hibiscus trionum]
MGEAPEIQLQILVEEHKVDENTVEPQTNGSINQSTIATRPRNYKWWLLMSIYTFFLLAGQSVATLLGRLYYDKGMYVGLGLLLAASSRLYSVGLSDLPVSTYSLICASQLAFNALFSFFLNSQKFTPFIINSLVLLTISATLLVFQNGSSGSTPVSKAKYVMGFVCTVAASAGYGLLLSLTQFCFQKVLKKQTFKVVLDMIIYQSLVATLIIFVGLFASGEWKGLGKEMEGFKLGKSSYVNVLVWIAICWQVFSIGSVGLILEASSLFSNVISTLGLPIIPVFAMVFFHDPMTGIKVISMVLAIWGFVSYVYQHYLDHRNSGIGKV